MTIFNRAACAALLVVGTVTSSAAQTAEDIVERHLTAVGGRAALAKLTSRTMTGTISVTIEAGDLQGQLEVTTATPNKSRTLLGLDLSAFGLGKMVHDERFDGSAGYILDSMQGNREITGNQLHNLRNDTFPTALLDYKGQGASVALAGKEKVDDRDAYVLIRTPKAGPPIKHYIDVESHLEIRTVTTNDSPDLGPYELTVIFGDYREVDGVKVPFQIRGVSNAENFNAVLMKVTHNQPVDAAIFSRPAP